MYKKLLSDLFMIGILVIGFSLAFDDWGIGIPLGCGVGVALSVSSDKKCCK